MSVTEDGKFCKDLFGVWTSLFCCFDGDEDTLSDWLAVILGSLLNIAQ